MDSFQRTNEEQPTTSAAKRKFCSTDAIVSKRALPMVDAFTQTVERDGWAIVEYLRHCFEEIEQRKAQGSAATSKEVEPRTRSINATMCTLSTERIAEVSTQTEELEDTKIVEYIIQIRKS